MGDKATFTFEKVGIIYVRRTANAQVNVLAGLAASHRGGGGWKPQDSSLERRLLSPLDDARECKAVYGNEVDPELVND